MTDFPVTHEGGVQKSLPFLVPSQFHLKASHSCDMFIEIDVFAPYVDHCSPLELLYQFRAEDEGSTGKLLPRGSRTARKFGCQLLNAAIVQSVGANYRSEVVLLHLLASARCPPSK